MEAIAQARAPGAEREDLQLGVVVLTHGPGGEYEPLVHSLLEQGVLADSIVVAHNPISDDEPALKPSVDRVHVVRTSGPPGPARGINSGMRFHLDRGKTTHVLILTRDVVLHDHAVTTLLDASTNAPLYGVLGPVLWWKNKNRPWSYGGFITPSGRITDRGTEPQGTDGIARCQWLDGAAMLIRTEVLHGVGLYDERFFMYYDDCDLCLRAERAGWRVGVVVNAVAEQEPGEASRPGAYAYLVSRNGLEFARRAVGVRGVAAGLLGLAREALWLTRQERGLGYAATPADRARAAIRLAGMRRGALDFIRRRWGHPPADLPGLGDIVAE